MSKSTSTPSQTSTVDPFAATARQEPLPPTGNPLDKPADVRADEAANAAEAAPTIDPRDARIAELERDLNDLLEGAPRPARDAFDVRDIDPANVVLALAEVYRVSQPVGGVRRQRYLDAAMKAGDQLADAVLGPVDAYAVG